ncbi:hypothetical protein Tco_0101323, partial [Tanacetum coccineum]
MGDDDWIEVRRKNRGSVFNRLSPPIKSSADDLAKVSTSVYISNFPSHLTVNFSNTLISSLNNIRIGKMRLHANKARFGRKSVTPKPTGKKGPSTWHNPPSNAASYANVTKSAPNHGGTNANPNE